MDLVDPERLAGDTRLNFDRAKQLCGLIFDEFTNEEITVVDSSFRIVDANDFPLKKYGLSRESVVGRRCHEIFHHCKSPNEGNRYSCPLTEIIKSQSPHRCVHVHLDKEGHKLIHCISSYPVFEGDQVVGMVQFSRDITSEANLQKHFGDQEKLAAIGRLAAGVAHEINNPLTTILTSAMLIQEEVSPDHPEFEELDLIAKEALRCREIVSSLLDFARQSEPQKSAQDINCIVAESVSLIRKHADFKEIRLSCTLPKGEILVHCDKGQIIQCLVNLAINAIDATSSRGAVALRTKLLPEKSWMEVSVSDTGSGLPDSIIDKIFEPFFTTKGTGTGLGLSITHGFVRQHRGFISVKNHAGKGATFTIRLPVINVTKHTSPVPGVISIP